MALLILVTAAMLVGCVTPFSPSVYDYYDFVDIPRTQTPATDRSDGPGFFASAKQSPRAVRSSDYEMTSAAAIQSRHYRPLQQIRPQYRQQLKSIHKPEPLAYRPGLAAYRGRPGYRQPSQEERPPLSRDRPQYPKQSRVPSRPRAPYPDEYPAYEERPRYQPRPQFQGRPEYDDLIVYDEEVRQLPVQYDDAQYQDDAFYRDGPQYEEDPQYQEGLHYEDSPQYEEYPHFQESPQYEEQLAYDDTEAYNEQLQYNNPPIHPVYEEAPVRPKYEETPKRPQIQEPPKRPQYQDRPATKKRPTYDQDAAKKESAKALVSEEQQDGGIKEKRQALHGGHDAHFDAAGKEFVVDAAAVEHGKTDGRLAFQIHGQQGPHSYRFGYDTGKGYNRQFRYEERDANGQVHGRYGFYDKDGKLQVVNYSAHPEYGFSADVPH